MKTWGQSGWGALLAVLLLLVSGIVLPLSAQAQGKSIYGFVSDCVGGSEVVAQVTLIDAHGVFDDWTQTTNDIGFFRFPEPQLQPGYYRVKVSPLGFTHYTREVGPYRFDGTATIPVNMCVDAIQPPNRWLNLTVVDAQPQTANEIVPFAETARGPENITDQNEFDYDPGTFLVSLDFAALVWNSELNALLYKNNTRAGERLVRGVHYDYSVNESFNGKIRVTEPTIRAQLRNTFENQPDRGYLTVTSYRSASNSSSLEHGETSNEVFSLNGTTVLAVGTDLTYDNASGAVTVTRDWAFGYDRLHASYDWAGGISGARVTIRDPNPARDQPIADPVTTGTNGRAPPVRVPSIPLEVKVEAPTYQPRLLSYGATGDIIDRVPLVKGWAVRVNVVNEAGQPLLVSDGLTGAAIAWIQPRKELRILAPQVRDGQVRFYAYDLAAPGWQVLVDANGYAAASLNVTVSGANETWNVTLSRTTQEKFVTEIAFRGVNDLGNITIWRNVSFLPDSEIPWIRFTGLRNLTRQIDFAFGDANGILDTAELDAFRDDMELRGPYYTDTVDFFTVNGKTYRSSPDPADYNVTWSNDGGGLTFHTRASYGLIDATKPIAPNKAKYFVNVTGIADKNVTQYQNYSFVVRLPFKYEMTSRTLQGNVTTRDFTNVTVDPGLDAGTPPRANMVVEFSLTGVARAEVEGPVGKVSVREADQAKYLAWVANDTAIVFSANKTTDRLNQAVNAKDANFTWKFLWNNQTPENDTRYGIWTTYDFGNQGANFTVFLNVTQVNPTNVTKRWINVTVDNVDPVASFHTNRTTGVPPPPMTIDEDQFTTFNGGDSTDRLWGPHAGKIADWKWDFDSNGEYDKFGQAPSYAYEKPGNYTMNLTVVDSVGHESANRSFNVTVRDVSPPTISFVILDPNNSWRQTATLTEGKMYFFDANATTDNSLNKTEDNVNLSYRWKWGVGEGQNGSDLGIRDPVNKGLKNVSHTWAKWGDYKLEVTVWDASDKNATVTRSPFTIQANVSAHPDVSIRDGTLKIDPVTPEEGQEVTFTFNITNAKGSADADQLRVMLAIRERNEDQNESRDNFTVQFLNGTTQVTNPVLTPEWNLTVKIIWHAPNKVANHSLRITVYDLDEPQPRIDSGNREDTSLLVKEAGWKFWAIVGAFLFVIFGLPIIYYVVRKVRAGEWQLRRKRGEEEEEEEEEEDEDEEEERGGKRRL